MKQKIVLFLSGLLIYFVFGILMILATGKDLPNKWLFLAIGRKYVTCSFFIMEPRRVGWQRKKRIKKK